MLVTLYAVLDLIQIVKTCSDAWNPTPSNRNGVLLGTCASSQSILHVEMNTSSMSLQLIILHNMKCLRRPSRLIHDVPLALLLLSPTSLNGGYFTRNGRNTTYSTYIKMCLRSNEISTSSRISSVGVG